MSLMKGNCQYSKLLNFSHFSVKTVECRQKRKWRHSEFDGSSQRHQCGNVNTDCIFNALVNGAAAAGPAPHRGQCEPGVSLLTKM